MNCLQLYILSNVGSFVFGAMFAAALFLERKESRRPERKSSDWHYRLPEVEASQPKDYENRK